MSLLFFTRAKYNENQLHLREKIVSLSLIASMKNRELSLCKNSSILFECSFKESFSWGVIFGQSIAANWLQKGSSKTWHRIALRPLFFHVHIYHEYLDLLQSFVDTVWLTYPFDSGFCNFAMKNGAHKAVFIIKWYENTLTLFITLL